MARQGLTSSLVDSWYERAAADRKRIVLADGGDQRADDAAAILNDRGLADAMVVNDPGDQLTDAARLVAEQLKKPVDLSDPVVVGALLVAAGDADACVAGASRPTADVLRAGLRVLGLAPEATAVSSSFFFVLPDGSAIVYGDCGVIPAPDAGQLAGIAVASAETFRELAAEEPRVAMLSFSTKGSAEHATIDLVREATSLAQSAAPTLAIDGELQFDAAWVPSIAASKAPGSSVAGRANVFVFPDLNSGNIAYKITERLGGARAYGPLLQGLNGVMHDLSRGCSVDDIVDVAVIASLQAG